MRTESRVKGGLYTTESLRMFISTEEWSAKESPLRSGLCLPEAAATTNLRMRGDGVVQEMACKEAGGDL